MHSIWQTAEYRELIGRLRASTSNYEPVANAIQIDGSATDETLVFQDGYNTTVFSFGGLPFNHVFDTLYNTKTHFKYVTTIGATTYTLDDSSIKQLNYTEKSVSGSQFSFGDFVGRLADFTLFDTDGTYDAVSFEGASGHLYFGVEKADTSIFWIDFGTFIVDDCKRTAATIWFALKDKRYLFDATMSAISSNKTIFQMAQEVCTQAGVTLGTASINLPNASLTITNTTELQSKTLSQLVSAIAQATGTFAVIGKDDKLYFKWYAEVSPIVSIPSNHINANMTVADYEIAVTGVSWTDVDGTSYSSGASTYIVKVQGNPFEFANYNTLLTAIAARVIGTSYVPVSLQYIGNPAIEVGDIIVVTDKRGNAYSLPVTSISIRNLMSQGLRSIGESHVSNSSNTTSATTTIETAKQEAIAFAKFQEIEANRVKVGGTGTPGLLTIKDASGNTVGTIGVDGIQITTTIASNALSFKASSTEYGLYTSAGVLLLGAKSIDGIMMGVSKYLVGGATESTYLAVGDLTPPIGDGLNGFTLYGKNDGTTTLPLVRMGGWVAEDLSAGQAIIFAGDGTFLAIGNGELKLYSSTGTLLATLP